MEIIECIVNIIIIASYILESIGKQLTTKLNL